MYKDDTTNFINTHHVEDAMIDTKELRRKICSDDPIDRIDIRARLRPLVTELLDRLEAAEKELAELRSSMKFRTSLIGRTEAERDALRAAVETTENDAAHQKALADSALRVAEGWEEKCNALRAKIAEMEQQEPVATIHINSITGNPSVDFIPGHRYLRHNSSLYALPGAKGEKDV